MHRPRFNYLRPDREMEGLQQVPQIPHSVPARKTTFTRTELVQRGATTTTTSRVKRLPTLNNGPDVAINRRSHFLPRVAKLATNNNNKNSNVISLVNTGRVVNRDKSPARKLIKSKGANLACDSGSLCARGQKLPLRCQQQQQPLQQQQQQQQQPLPLLGSVSSSMSNSLSNSSSDLRKIKLARAFQLPDEQNKSFVYLCKPVKKVKDLLMVHSLHNSIEDLLMDRQTDDSPEQRESESYSCCSSLNLPQDLGQKLGRSSSQPSSYRDMLETRLHDVRQREHQLQQLAAKVQLEQSDEKIPDRGWQSERVRRKDAEYEEPQQQLLELQVERNFDMEFVRQNIPTLQREIRLLQQLGEKLEATLRANMQQMQPMEPLASSQESYTVFHTPRSTFSFFGPTALPIVHLGFRRVEQLAPVVGVMRLLVHRRCFGCIREFRIETKTLSELKTADETQCFYLPLAENGGLERTSFRKLRETPNVLLQQLRPLSPSRPFNLLEQDAMFFNSMLSHSDVQLLSCKSNTNSVASPLDELLPRESGGGGHQLPLALTLPYSRLSVRPQFPREKPTWTPEDVERMLLSSVRCETPPAEAARMERSFCDLMSKSRTSLKSRPSTRWQRPSANRCRTVHRRQVAPLFPLSEPMQPQMQTQLLKTVLVGIAQVAVFLVLIMAFTYPDIRC